MAKSEPHPLDLPLTVYRRLAAALKACEQPAERSTVIQSFLQELDRDSRSGRYLKMKLILPAYFKEIATPEEYALIQNHMAKLRKGRNQRLLNVFPLCGDEFTLDPDFLEACFGSQRTPLFDRDTPILTIGSCFADNMGRHLKSLNHNVTMFPLSEDMNSPSSNAVLLEMATSPAAADALRWWGERLVKRREDVQRFVDQEMNALGKFRESVSNARLLIFTLGNTLDHHLNDDLILPFSLSMRVAPKFFRVWYNTNDEIGKATAVYKHAGAVFRMLTFSETTHALQVVHEAIRKINPTVPIIYTVSPVPIDNVIGLHDSPGAVEIDCRSKSTLRAAIDELLGGWSDAYYFPAYEIVRWLGAMLPQPNFGADDSSSRLVSQQVLDAVYGLFLQRHGAPTAPAGDPA